MDGSYAAALHGYVQNLTQIHFVIENNLQGLRAAESALSECGLSFIEKKSGSLYFQNPNDLTEEVVINSKYSHDECQSITKIALAYKIPVMTLYELQKKSGFQIQDRNLVSKKSLQLQPIEILQILEDFRLLKKNPLNHKKEKSILISLKVPNGLLSQFKTSCSRKELKYQTQIKELMSKWLLENESTEQKNSVTQK